MTQVLVNPSYCEAPLSVITNVTGRNYQFTPDTDLILQINDDPVYGLHCGIDTEIIPGHDNCPDVPAKSSNWFMATLVTSACSNTHTQPLGVLGWFVYQFLPLSFLLSPGVTAEQEANLFKLTWLHFAGTYS